MNSDSTNPVVALCAAGMAVEGDPDAARRLFEQAWDSRQDDYDASIAAHFLARQQLTPEARLHWNAVAVQHAASVTDGRTREFHASLFLNLADSHFVVGERAAALTALDAARTHARALPEGGYRTFVQRGIAGLEHRLAAADSAS